MKAGMPSPGAKSGKESIRLTCAVRCTRPKARAGGSGGSSGSAFPVWFEIASLIICEAHTNFWSPPLSAFYHSP